MRGSWSSTWAARPNAPPKIPPMTSDGPKSPALPPEPTVSPVARILTHPRTTSSSTPRHPRGNPVGAADGELRGPVAAAEDPQSLPGLPQPRPDEDDDRGREQAEGQSAESSLAPLGHPQPLGRGLDPPQGRKEDPRHEAHGEREQSVERQVSRHERVAGRVGEEGLLAEEGDEDRVRDDARQDARHERVRLEVVAVKDLDGEQRRPERGAEDGRHARRRARDEQDAPLADGDAQQLTHERSDGAAHLHRGPLASSGAAQAQREGRGERLHERHPLAHDAAVLVERLDDRVGSAPARLRRKPPGQPSAEQRADGRQDEQQPRPEWRALPHVLQQRLASGAQRQVPGPPFEAHALDPLQARVEDRAEQPRRRAHERGVKQHAPQDLELDRRARAMDQTSKAAQRAEDGSGQARGRSDRLLRGGCRARRVRSSEIGATPHAGPPYRIRA